MQCGLGRTSENLVTSANAGSNLVILRLRVTETVELRLDDECVRTGYPQNQRCGPTREAMRDPPNQTAYR